MKTKIAILTLITSAFLITACSDKTDSTATIQKFMEDRTPLCATGGLEDLQESGVPTYDIPFNAESHEFRPDIVTAKVAQFSQLLSTQISNEKVRDTKTGVYYDSSLRVSFVKPEGIKYRDEKAGICLGHWVVTDVSEGEARELKDEGYSVKEVTFSYKIDQVAPWMDQKILEKLIPAINKQNDRTYYSLDGSTKATATMIKTTSDKEWSVNKITYDQGK